MDKFKMFIVGHGRHGKTQMAEQIRDDWGLTFADSSRFMADRLVMQEMKDRFGIEYADGEECWKDRHNHRPKWYKIISEYNQNNPSRLTAAIFEENQIYVGCRNRDEFLASKHLADISVWVDGSQRHGPEPSSSMSILQSDCDIVIQNNESLIVFQEKVHKLMCCILGQPTIKS